MPAPLGLVLRLAHKDFLCHLLAALILLHALSSLARDSARGDIVGPLPCFSGPVLLVAAWWSSSEPWSRRGAGSCPAPSRDTLRAYVTAAAYSPNEVGETPKWNIFDIFLANARLDTKCAELRRIPLLRGSVNKGKKRKDRARRRRSGVFVLDKDTGPPFGQDESLLL